MPKLKKYLVTTLDLTIHHIILKRMEDGEDMQARQASFLEKHEYTERTCHAVRHEVDITGRHAVIWLCSECGDYISLAHNYCPNCGAKVVDE